jgi:hypothetical protein
MEGITGEPVHAERETSTSFTSANIVLDLKSVRRGGYTLREAEDVNETITKTRGEAMPMWL